VDSDEVCVQDEVNQEKSVQNEVDGMKKSWLGSRYGCSLAADLRRLSDMPSRRRLRSSLTDQLDVRQSQCSTVGD